MVFLTARFLHLFLVLVALGSIDTGSLGPISGAKAAPAGSATAARVGIVLKDDVGDTSTAASSVAPSRRGSAFDAYDISQMTSRDAFSVPLEHIDGRSDGTLSSDPAILFQQHLNRANVKLAKMQKRATPTAEELTRALWNRRRSIEESFGGRRGSMQSIQERDEEHNPLEPRGEKVAGSFKASTSRLPSNHGRIGVATSGSLQAVEARHHDQQQKRLWPGVYQASDKSSTDDQTAQEATVTTKSNSTSSSTLKTDTSKQSSIAAAREKANQLAYTDTLLPAAAVTANKSLGLAIEANNIGYVATVQIGSRKTNFKMLIDSGSADTWVASTKCKDCGSSQQRLGKSISSTLVGSKTAWSITYGTGSAQGHLATDSLTIAGMTLKKYQLALAESESDDFSSSPFDGLMGLAQQKLSNAGGPTPIDALYNAKKVAAPVMGYNLGDATASTPNVGEVTFGGVDSSRYTGALVEIPNVSTEGFYEVPIQGVSINGQAIASLSTGGRTSILDTGTSLMVAPQADAEAVHAQIPGSTSDGSGGFTIPCNSTAVLSFKLGGQEWPLLARDMIFVPLYENDPNGQCISALGGGNVGQSGEWLVGAAALKRMYFATNAKQNVIGLGKLSTAAK